MDFALIATMEANCHVLVSASLFPSFNFSVPGCWNNSSSALIDQPAIYNWHPFSFLAGPSAFLSMLRSPCQDMVARRASVQGQMIPVGAEECSLPCIPQQVCGGIFIMLLVELHLLLVFRAPDHFHTKC